MLSSLNLALPLQEELPEAISDFDSDNSAVKDSTEIELEKIIFGDDAGFHEDLRLHKTTKSARALRATERVVRETLDGSEEPKALDDADVCNWYPP